MKLKELLELIDSEEYFDLYVIGEDFYVTDEDGFGILDKTDEEIKPYLNCRVTSIATATNLDNQRFIRIEITRAEE